MVLGRGNKNSSARAVRPDDPSLPPPPYKENSYTGPIVLAETTQTTRTEVVTTTTQTTTHLFSLPLWRRRRAIPPSSARQSLSGAEESGLMTDTAASGAFMTDKALPPTPTWSQETHKEVEELFPQTDPTVDGTLDVAAPELLASSSKFDALSPRRTIKQGQFRSPPPPTLTLAKASLGLGLTNIIPIPQTRSSPDINTVAFAAPEAPQAGIRRAKSSQKLSSTYSSKGHTTPLRKSLEFGERWRTNSMNGSALQFGDKGKGKERDDTSVQSLSRRPSFWSRKKKDDMPAPPAIPAVPERTVRPSLPSVLPASPFNIDLGTASSSSPSTSRHQHGSPRSPGLSRSLSERASFHSHTSPLPLDTNVSRTLPIAKRSSHSPKHRPATADAFTHISPHVIPSRPTTADPSHAPPARFFSVDPSSSRSPMKPSLTLPHEEPHLQEPSTRRRPRSQTNPPLLHRLSVNLFSSGPASTTKTSGVFGPNMFATPPMPTSDSQHQSISRAPAEIPKPQVDEESPDTYVERLLSVVSKAEVAGVLASSGDPFYTNALRSYIGRFTFKNDPLDVALRKLLMEVGLPRETQQIDRVVEAFATRYVQSNTNLFTSDDHPYIIAFSLIMLHTDAFNKSNKRKMSKPDYVKNTRLPGVPPEVLECFFDNIVFAPFIFIEDPLDINGQRGLIPEGVSKIGSQGSSPVNGSATTLLGRASKIDPYFLITHNLLDPLRVPVETYVPLESPYSYKGTGDQWNEEELQRVFSQAAVIEVGAVETTKSSSSFFPVTVGGMPGPMGAMGEFFLPTDDVWTLKVTKVGLLDRKDDTVEGGKKATNRKWKTWSVLLTGSQLLLFRDSSWATLLLDSPDGHVVIPQASLFKPDELLSVKDAIAVFDKSYTKYQNTLRFVAPDGRQFLLRTSNEKELNEWISRINYASAFKSTGVRMRALGMSDKDMELTGVAAATSHLHDMQHQRRSEHKVHSWDGETAHDLMDMLSGSNEPFTKKQSGVRRFTMVSGQNDMDLDVPIAPEIEGAHQFKVTFDQVKAELAAGNWSSSDESSDAEDKPRPRSLDSIALRRAVPVRNDSLPLPSRSQIVQSKISDLESRIVAAESLLDADMRFVRNVAIMTPFQKATRDRLQAAVQNVSKRIMQMRIDLIKLTCHRDVLSGDLAAERRNMHMAKDLAFRAAAETLQSRRSTHVPTMTLSFHGDPSAASLQSPPDKPETPPRRPESSIAESFHSALDFGPEWSISDDITFNFPYTSDSPCLLTPITPAGTHGSQGAFPFPETYSNPECGSRHLDHTPSSLGEKEVFNNTHKRFYTVSSALEGAEECEEWNKTRAAKRVSLVRVPSDIRPSTRFVKQSHQANIEEDLDTSLQH